MSLSLQISALQPHKGSSETRSRRIESCAYSFNPTRVRLKLARWSMSTPCQSFNPTRVRLKRCAIPARVIDLGLQPHKGSSETWNCVKGPGVALALQPHKGSSETMPDFADICAISAIHGIVLPSTDNTSFTPGGRQLRESDCLRSGPGRRRYDSTAYPRRVRRRLLTRRR